MALSDTHYEVCDGDRDGDKENAKAAPGRIAEYKTWVFNERCRAVFPTMLLTKIPDEASSTKGD